MVDRYSLIIILFDLLYFVVALPFITYYSQIVHFIIDFAVKYHIEDVVGQLILYGFLFVALSPVMGLAYYYDNRPPIENELSVVELKSRSLTFLYISLFLSLIFVILGLQLSTYFPLVGRSLALFIVIQGFPLFIGSHVFHFMIGRNVQSIHDTYVPVLYPCFSFMLTILSWSLRSQMALFYFSAGVFIALVSVVSIPFFKFIFGE
ncbi:MAG: hypothetical protein ACP6IP_05975 [Candidatus Njordarchaeia archaeon]